MKPFSLEPAEGRAIDRNEGVSFEQMVVAVSRRLARRVGALTRPNYPRQRVLVVRSYACCCPSSGRQYFFLKTVIPSRKATRDYLNLGDPRCLSPGLTPSTTTSWPPMTAGLRSVATKSELASSRPPRRQSWTAASTSAFRPETCRTSRFARWRKACPPNPDRQRAQVRHGALGRARIRQLALWVAPRQSPHAPDQQAARVSTHLQLTYRQPVGKPDVPDQQIRCA